MRSRLPFVMTIVVLALGLRGGPWAADIGAPIALVGNESIHERDFVSTLERFEKWYRESYGPQWRERVTWNEVAAQALERLIYNELLVAEADAQTLVVNATTLEQKIRSYPAFQDEFGRFVGRKVYLDILASAGMQVASFEASLRKDLLREALTGLFRTEVEPRDAEVDHAIRARHELAEVEFVWLQLTDFLIDVAVSDNDVEEHLKNRADDYRHGEQRVIRYLAVEPSRLVRQLPLDDERAADYYQQHQGQFTTPEQARAGHILCRVFNRDDAAERASVLERASGLVARLRNGENFGELAAEHSDDVVSKESGGDLGWFARGRMVGEFESSVFNSQAGDVVGPVESAFGFHVIHIQGFKPEALKPLSQVLDEIRVELLRTEAHQEAASRAVALISSFGSQPPMTDQEWQAIADRDPAVVLLKSWAFERSEPVPGFEGDDELLEQAFAAEVGTVHGPRSAERGEIVWQLAEIRAAGAATVGEVRLQILSSLLQRGAMEAAGGKAHGLAEAWRRGLQPEGVTKLPHHSRGMSFGYCGPQDALDELIFEAKVGEVVGPVEIPGKGVAIARLGAQKLVAKAQLENERDEQRASMTEQRLQARLAEVVEGRKAVTVIMIDQDFADRFELEAHAGARKYGIVRLTDPSTRTPAPVGSGAE